jgi:hypothetical protein
VSTPHITTSDLQCVLNTTSRNADVVFAWATASSFVVSNVASAIALIGFPVGVSLPSPTCARYVCSLTSLRSGTRRAVRIHTSHHNISFSLTHSLTHSLALIYSLVYPLTHSLALTHSLVCPLDHSLALMNRLGSPRCAGVVEDEFCPVFVSLCTATNSSGDHMRADCPVTCETCTPAPTSAPTATCRGM